VKGRGGSARQRDEEGAYYAQLMALHRLGLGPGTRPYFIVTRSMQAALQSHSRTDWPSR
jgi:hypothetical protein